MNKYINKMNKESYKNNNEYKRRYIKNCFKINLLEFMKN